jgi:hypothetical protein
MISPRPSLLGHHSSVETAVAGRLPRGLGTVGIDAYCNSEKISETSRVFQPTSLLTHIFSRGCSSQVFCLNITQIIFYVANFQLIRNYGDQWFITLRFRLEKLTSYEPEDQKVEMLIKMATCINTLFCQSCYSVWNQRESFICPNIMIKNMEISIESYF